MLDGIADGPGTHVTLDAPERHLRLTVAGPGLFDVAWRVGPAASLSGVDRVDILVAHQLALRFTTSRAGAVLDGFDEVESEVLLWPAPGATRATVEADFAGDDSRRVTNVYEVGGRSWSRMERWTHHASTPPNFADLVFDVSLAST